MFSFGVISGLAIVFGTIAFTLNISSPLDQ
jgi:hypothetical protein